MISFYSSHKIDELGRVVLPIELRNLLGWESGDSLAVILNEEENFVTLRMSEKHRGARCVFCGTAEEAIKLNGRGVCGSCLTKIKET